MKISLLLKLCFLFFFISTSMQLFADDEIPTGIVRGKITTSDGKPAAYVSVSIDQLKKGSITNGDGEYIIKKIPEGTWALRISSVGVNSQEKSITIKANETVYVNFQVEQNAQQLEEVVVNAQRQNRSSDYANKMPLSFLENAQSYSTISKDLIKDQVLFTVDDALNNVVGMQQMWSATGRSGDGGSYYDLRGFPTQATMRNGLASMITTTTDAANIEKVEILKGPSATLYGSALTTYGGLINRVTKKPYDSLRTEINIASGGYNFFRGSIDFNTPIDNAKKVLFRLNGSYNTQGNFQKITDNGNRTFIAPSLLIKPSDKLSISLEAELTYTKSIPSQFIFLYFPGSIGFDNAAASGLDYKNSYTGKGIHTTSRSANYFGNITYKISDNFSSFTNVSYSRSYSNGQNQYFFQVPTYMVTQNLNDIDTPSHYLARADQSTINSRRNIFEAQQYFNGQFNIGSMKNRVVLGLDYININSDQIFQSQYSYIDVVPTNIKGFDYSTFTGATINHYYDTANAAIVQHYPSISNSNIYSAFVSDVLNVTDQLDIIAALRIDHYNNHDKINNTSFNQTTLSPKFGLVYQIVKDRVSVFANYQNSFTNEGTYIAYDESSADSLVSKFAKPEHANQWECGIRTNLINNLLTATVSYYNIKVDDILRADDRDPAKAQIQNGTEVSRGVELEVSSNPFKGFSIFGGVAYNDSKYENISDNLNGHRTQYSGSPWLANWWFNYKCFRYFSIGFGGNYASENRLIDSKSQGIFYLPAYTVLNTALSFEQKHIGIALKVNNLTNKKYWQGYSTYNPQMLRQFVASISYKF